MIFVGSALVLGNLTEVLGTIATGMMRMRLALHVTLKKGCDRH